MQSRLLSAAILAALSMSAPAFAADLSTSPTAVRGKALVEGSASALSQRAADDNFVARDALVDADGTEHVRFARTYRGLPVIGGDIVIHSRNGVTRSTSQTLRSTRRPALLPGISVDTAVVEAGTRFGTGFTGVPTANLVVYALRVTPTLAYEVRYTGMKADQTPTDMRYFVDARNGQILNQWDTIETAQPGPDPTCTSPTPATGTGKALLLGDVSIQTSKCGARYQLFDTTRGGGSTNNMSNRTTGFGTVVTDTDNVWGNGLNTDAATVAVDAHYGVSLTWDYYKTVHERTGIANDGKGALSRVHYGRNYANAFWSDACFCMTFGDGDGATLAPLVALDIAGHEMSHGVTSTTAGLVYADESGGLNEANSDIFGTMVEYYANDPSDPGDYLIGEKIYKNNPDGTAALRYMFKPSLDGVSYDCYEPGFGSDDPHFTSGVANHFYYLLAEGSVVPAGFGTGSPSNLAPADLVCAGSSSLAGVGRDVAGRIWYRALTVYMTSGTTYADARTATINASTDLYGADSANTTAVAAAWTAVGVNAVAPASLTRRGRL